MAARQPPQHGSRSDHAPRHAGPIRRVPAAHHTRDSSRAAGTKHGRIVGAGPRPVDASLASLTPLSRPCASIWRSSSRTNPARSPSRARGDPLRRGNLNKMSAWPHAVESIGTVGRHFHDLRHTGNQFQQRCRAPGPDGPHRATTASGPPMITGVRPAAAPTSSSRTPSTPTSRMSSARTTRTTTGQPGHWSLRANGTEDRQQPSWGPQDGYVKLALTWALAAWSG